MPFCRKCEALKETEFFPRDRRNKSGISSWCKECHRKKSREKEAEPGYREKRAAKMRERRKRPEFLEKERVRRVANRDKKRQQDRKSRSRPESRARILWAGARRRANKKGDAFFLTVGRVESALIAGACERTGSRFDLSPGRTADSPSIDRIDPELPYSDDNVNIVCDWYNMAKGRLSEIELIERCKTLIAAVEHEVK